MHWLAKYFFFLNFILMYFKNVFTIFVVLYIKYVFMLFWFCIWSMCLWFCGSVYKVCVYDFCVLYIKYVFTIFQLCYTASYIPLFRGKLESWSSCDTFHFANWCHYQHGWHSLVRSSGTYIYCPDEWHWSLFWTNHYCQVIFNYN